MRGLIGGLLVVSVVSVGSTTAMLAPVDEVPSAFLPFESMIGGWKGTAASTANRVKGWQEAHSWAWKFEKGKPVGLNLTLEGNKTLARGAMSFDAAAKKYKLDGTDPDGKAGRLRRGVQPGRQEPDPRPGGRDSRRGQGTFGPPPQQQQDPLHAPARPPGAQGPAIQEPDHRGPDPRTASRSRPGGAAPTSPSAS